MGEPLLSEPKHMKIMQQQIPTTEASYSIDGRSKHEMMTQICNDGQINLNEYDKMDLATQQDILLSTLSNFLVEPSLCIPMTIGMYSRWGSGKSSYIQRLVEFLQEYKEQAPLRPFTITFILTLACFTFGFNFGLIASAIGDQKSGTICGMCMGIFLIGLFLFSRLSITSANNKIRNFAITVTIFCHRFLVLLKLIYCVPPSIDEFRSILPVHLIMVELSQNAIIEEDPIGPLVSFTDALNDAVEKDFGIFIPRLYRIFQGKKKYKNPPPSTSFHSQWKTSCCCLPSFLITVFIFFCLWVAIILYNIYGLTGPITVRAIQIACCCVFGGGLVSYLLRAFLMTYCMCLPMKKRVQIVANRAGIHEDGFLSVLKHELDLYVEMIECIDGLNHRQTRIVVHIDLVDSLEQQKVLNIINSINLLVTEPGYPFILVLSVDPRLLIKALDQTLSNMQEPVACPYEYFKNMVDLPCYINEYPKLRIERIIPPDLSDQFEDKLELSEDEEEDLEWAETDDLIPGSSNGNEIENGHVPLGDGTMSLQRVSERSVKFPSDESLASLDNQAMLEQEEENIGDDISQLLRNNENNTLNDVKRIMNIVSLKGRILRYQNIPFQWTRLAIWVSFCDGWPYKASWVILLCLDSALNLPGTMSIRRLHTLFGFLMPAIGDKNLGMDSSNTYFDTFIASHRPIINVNEARSFATFVFHIDPTLRRLMIDFLLAMKSSKQPPVQHQSSISSSTTQFEWMNVVSPDALLRMSVDDVVSQLLLIEGMNESLLQEYKIRLIENNVNGRVLMACDLNDLRDVMQMKFGDWQLFRAWVSESRRKDQQMTNISEEKIPTDQPPSYPGSCFDGSQTESNHRTPKQSASGNIAKNSYRLPSRSKKSDIKHVPYASHLTPQLTRKSLKDMKTSVSQDSDSSSPHHLISDHVLHHSVDSGFASTEVDQNHRLMLSLQRQSLVPEFEEPIEHNESMQLNSINSNAISVHVEDCEKNGPPNIVTSGVSSKVSESRIDKTSNLLTNTETSPPQNIYDQRKQKPPDNIELADGHTKYEILDENLTHSMDTTTPLSEGPRPPSLSEVPLPPLSMLNDGVSWPMDPPAEFDDNHVHPPSPTPSIIDEQSKLNVRSPVWRGVSADYGKEFVSKNHKNSSTRSEPYAIDFSAGTVSSLRKSASVGYYDYNKKPSLRLTRSALGKNVLLDQDE